MQLDVHESGENACRHTCNEGDHQAEPGIHALQDKHAAEHSAQRKCAVNRQIRKVQNAVSDIHSHREERIHKSLV